MVSDIDSDGYASNADTALRVDRRNLLDGHKAYVKTDISLIQRAVNSKTILHVSFFLRSVLGGLTAPLYANTPQADGGGLPVLSLLSLSKYRKGLDRKSLVLVRSNSITHFGH